MIKMKVGGMILTGCAAFLMVNKIVNTVDAAVKRTCETAKWRGYYRCWSKGQASGEPVAPGYSMTNRPLGCDYEVVRDPEGKDHSQDNVQNSEKDDKAHDTVNAVIDAVKAVAEKAIDTLKKGPEAPEEALEGDLEASESECSVTDEDNDIFSEKIVVKEQDQDETVD